MKVTNKILENLAIKYHCFAYALLPDELMATQLLIDSITKMTVIYRDDKDSIPEQELFELEFLKNIFQLSVIRLEHFRASRQLESYNHGGEDSSFFLIGLKERACLFLKDKLNFSFRDTAYILGLNYEEALAAVHRSRAEYLELLNYRESTVGAIRAH